MNEEFIAKAREAKSVEELLALAKESNYPLTEEEARNYFNQFHFNGELSDDELDQVGGGCGGGEEEVVVPAGYFSKDIDVLEYGCYSYGDSQEIVDKRLHVDPRCRFCAFCTKNTISGRDWYRCEKGMTPTYWGTATVRPIDL